MKKVVIASLFIAILSMALSIFVLLQIQNSADKTVKVAGVIRCIDEKGWFVINDGGHTPVNINRIEVKNGLILVYYTFSASTIHSFIVSPDETFAGAGYFVGASVNRDRASIAVSRIINGKVVPVDASTIRSKLGNFWIYGLFSIDESDS